MRARNKVSVADVCRAYSASKGTRLWTPLGIGPRTRLWTHLNHFINNGKLRFHFGAQISKDFPEEFLVVAALLHRLLPIDYAALRGCHFTKMRLELAFPGMDGGLPQDVDNRLSITHLSRRTVKKSRVIAARCDTIRTGGGSTSCCRGCANRVQ